MAPLVVGGSYYKIPRSEKTEADEEGGSTRVGRLENTGQSNDRYYI